MAKKMLIDATHPEETRVVVVDGQKVEDFDFESITKRQLAGNIYLAKVTRVEPSLQAAFVEYGGNRHGFLAFSEVHPDYYQIPVADREALLEEERREEESRKAREENGDDEPKPKRGRGRRKKAAAPTAVTEEEVSEVADVAGLEVIDLGSDVTAESLEVADLGERTAAETDVPSEAVERAQAPAPETDVAAAEDPPRAEGPTADIATSEQDVPVADAGEPPVDESITEGAADSDVQEKSPRSIAESAGLEDEDRVTGDLDVAERARKASSEEATTDSAPDTGHIAEPAIEVAEVETDTVSATDDAPQELEAAVTPTEEPTTNSDPDGDVLPTAAEASASTEDDAEPAEELKESPKDDTDPGKSSRRGRRRRVRSKRSDDDDTTPDETEDSDVESVGAEDTLEEAARARTHLRRKYKIQDVIKVRQILLVQVVKEERGNKGAALTTYLSLAGRYCVLMPNTARGGGISRKITNAPDRKRLREVISEMDVPTGMGLIVRTAGAERTRAEIKRDYEFLIRQWEQIRELTLKSIAPTLIYEEGSLIKRSIRDIYSKEIDQIQVEGEQGYREAKEYMKMLMPSHAKNVQPYTDPTPLFSRFQVESYLNGMFNPTVQLKSGGYIVIGVTEALVAIDVNSGRATKQGSIEETALQTNLEASDEVARQLRLRDLAGLIVIDFIDMDENRNNRAVEKRMKERLKNDRARIQVGRISAFGLMEMSRQRLRPGMLEATTQPCPHCMGTGLIRSDENLSLSILREVEEEALRGRADEITVRAPVDVANYLINHKRPHIAQLEARHGIQVIVLADPALTSPNFEIERSKSAVSRPKPQADVITASSAVTDVEEAEVVEPEEKPDREDEEARGRRRRGKRGGRRRRGETDDEQPQETQSETEEVAADGEDAESKPGRSRRSRGRRRGGRGRRGPEGGDGQEAVEGQEVSAESADAAEASEPVIAEATVTADTPVTVSEEPHAAEALVESVPEAAPAEPEPQAETPQPEAVEEPVVAEVLETETTAPEAPAPEEPAKPKRRGWWSFGS
ncbi:MAG: Rne/Rng family ribonuclease [Pseudomonadota bacterium]